MCTLQNHVEKVCTLVSLNHVYFKSLCTLLWHPFLKGKLKKCLIFTQIWNSDIWRENSKLFTFCCSDSAWKVCTETICWNRLRLIRMNAFSSFAILASAVLTSWIKNLSRDKGCLYTTYFMPCNPSLVTLECSFTAGEGQFSPRLDFCNRDDESF